MSSATSVSMARSGSFLLIFRRENPAGFVLDRSTSLAPALWIPISTPLLQVGNQYLESNRINSTKQFYRLRVHPAVTGKRTSITSGYAAG